MDGVSTDSD